MRNGEGGFGGWLFSILPVAFKRGLSVFGKGEGPTAVLLSLDDNMEVSHAGGTDLPSSICVFPRGLEGRRPTEREDFCRPFGKQTPVGRVCPSASRAGWEVPLGEHPVPALFGLWLSHLWNGLVFQWTFHLLAH